METAVLLLVHSAFLFHGLESNNLYTLLCTCGICTEFCVYQTIMFLFVLCGCVQSHIKGGTQTEGV
jgi:hypothetical protein